MSKIHILIFVNFLSYSVLYLLNNHNKTAWQPGKFINDVWTRGSWKSDKQYNSPSLIQDGTAVKDREDFPWFVFLSYGFPDLTWEIWDPKTQTISYKKEDRKWFQCGGVWVTVHMVVTVNHCVYLNRPIYHVQANSGEDPRKSVVEDAFYRNVITDPIRGKKENVAIRLYGLSHFNSEPWANPHDDEGTIHPWWERETNSRAFRVTKYRTLPTTDPPMDLAILEMNKKYITGYFTRRSIDLTDIFTRLLWVEKNKDKIEVGQIIIQLGSGEISDTDPNDWQVLQMTYDYSRIGDDVCRVDPQFTPAWEICFKSWGKGRTRRGDSGSPGFTLAGADGKKIYMLQSLVEKRIAEDSDLDIHMYVGDLKDQIIGLNVQWTTGRP